jgi:peptidyl-prolyl cis-trans isomerase C
MGADLFDVRSSIAQSGDTGAQPARRWLSRSIWPRLRREPLLQFLVLGGLIFAVAHVVQSGHSATQRRIVVDAQLQRRIVEINQSQSGITPRGAQLERLTEEYIDDEVMYREALRMGLDQDDEIVRRRLIQKVRFLQRDLATGSKPSEVDLNAYYSAHPELFAAPASVSFEQLYFSADRGGWPEAEVRARRALNRIARTPTSSIEATADDTFPFEIPAEDFTRVEAGRVFGDTPILDALFGAPVGQWSEPVRSAYGWHLIRVNRRRQTNVTPFEEARAQVEAAYTQDQMDAAEQREMQALRARYEIVRVDKPSPGP